MPHAVAESLLLLSVHPARPRWRPVAIHLVVRRRWGDRHDVEVRGKGAVPVGSVRFVGSYAMPAGRDADACRRRVWGWLRRPPTNNSWQAGERIGVQGRAGEGHGPRDVRAWCDREVVMAKQAANVPRGGCWARRYKAARYLALRVEPTRDEAAASVHRLRNFSIVTVISGSAGSASRCAFATASAYAFAEMPIHILQSSQWSHY